MSFAKIWGGNLARWFFAKHPRRTGLWALRHKQRQRTSARHKIIFEALEPRLLLSGTPVTVSAPVELTRAPSGQAAAVESAQLPPGSQIYGSTLRESFLAAGEVDTFNLSADAGQKLTVELQPQSASVKGQVEVLDPQGVSLGTVAADVAGGFVVLQNVPLAQQGTYSVKFSSLEGTGNYDLKVWLNTARETEPFGGPANNDLASAINLNGSSIALQAAADHLAVLGQAESGTPDYYRFDLTTGQSATVALSFLDGSTSLSLDLRNAAGAVLATGLADATNVDQYIRNFIAPASEQLPSPALGSEGGGLVPLDPSDTKGQKAAHTMFQVDLRLPTDVPVLNVGGRVYIRFDHGWAPFGVQWVRTLRQLFLARFNA